MPRVRKTTRRAQGNGTITAEEKGPTQTTESMPASSDSQVVHSNGSAPIDAGNQQPPTSAVEASLTQPREEQQRQQEAKSQQHHHPKIKENAEANRLESLPMQPQTTQAIKEAGKAFVSRPAPTHPPSTHHQSSAQLAHQGARDSSVPPTVTAEPSTPSMPTRHLIPEAPQTVPASLADTSAALPSRETPSGNAQQDRLEHQTLSQTAKSASSSGARVAVIPNGSSQTRSLPGPVAIINADPATGHPAAARNPQQLPSQLRLAPQQRHTAINSVQPHPVVSISMPQHRTPPQHHYPFQAQQGLVPVAQQYMGVSSYPVHPIFPVYALGPANPPQQPHMPHPVIRPPLPPSQPQQPRPHIHATQPPCLRHGLVNPAPGGYVSVPPESRVCGICLNAGPKKVSRHQGSIAPQERSASSAISQDRRRADDESSSVSVGLLHRHGQNYYDPVLKCNQCGVQAHATCYGIPFSLEKKANGTPLPPHAQGAQAQHQSRTPQAFGGAHFPKIDKPKTAPAAENPGTDYAWFCEPCLSGVIAPCCAACPQVGGLLKMTPVPNVWVHATCAAAANRFYGPEQPEQALFPLTLSKLPPNAWNAKACDICLFREDASKGIVIECGEPTCSVHFHATCAYLQGLLTTTPSSQPRCPAHANPLVKENMHRRVFEVNWQAKPPAPLSARPFESRVFLSYREALFKAFQTWTKENPTEMGAALHHLSRVKKSIYDQEGKHLQRAHPRHLANRDASVKHPSLTRDFFDYFLSFRERHLNANIEQSVWQQQALICKEQHDGKAARRTQLQADVNKDTTFADELDECLELLEAIYEKLGEPLPPVSENLASTVNGADGMEASADLATGQGQRSSDPDVTTNNEVAARPHVSEGLNNSERGEEVVPSRHCQRNALRKAMKDDPSMVAYLVSTPLHVDGWKGLRSIMNGVYFALELSDIDRLCAEQMKGGVVDDSHPVYVKPGTGSPPQSPSVSLPSPSVSVVPPTSTVAGPTAEETDNLVPSTLDQAHSARIERVDGEAPGDASPEAETIAVSGDGDGGELSPKRAKRVVESAVTQGSATEKPANSRTVIARPKPRVQQSRAAPSPLSQDSTSHVPASPKFQPQKLCARTARADQSSAFAAPLFRGNIPDLFLYFLPDEGVWAISDTIFSPKESALGFLSDSSALPWLCSRRSGWSYHDVMQDGTPVTACPHVTLRAFGVLSAQEVHDERQLRKTQRQEEAMKLAPFQSPPGTVGERHTIGKATKKKKGGRSRGARRGSRGAVQRGKHHESSSVAMGTGRKGVPSGALEAVGPRTRGGKRGKSVARNGLGRKRTKHTSDANVGRNASVPSRISVPGPLQLSSPSATAPAMVEADAQHGRVGNSRQMQQSLDGVRV